MNRYDHNINIFREARDELVALREAGASLELKSPGNDVVERAQDLGHPVVLLDEYLVETTASL